MSVKDFYGLALVVLQLIHVLHGKSCEITTGVNVLQGTCKELRDCPAALSNLYAGIDPSVCPPEKNNGKSLACCPTTERISRKKCHEYQKVNEEPDGPLPLLPIEFIKERLSYRDDKGHCKRQPVKLIVGGRDSTREEFPHMAAIGYGSQEDKKWLCGGTLISEDFVLTAAHCIKATSEKVRRVLLGAIKLSHDDERQIIDVSRIIVHPNYNHPYVYNDIALLQLKTKVKLKKSIVPACLPQPELRLEKVNATMQVTGWGLLETGGVQSEVLQAVQLSRFPQKKCQQIFDNKVDRELRYPQGVQRSQFCAGSSDGSNKDSCHGDSGGPLTVTLKNDRCTYYVAGIVSFGNQFCGVEPGVYTNVQTYLDWIEKTVWP